MKSSRDSSKSKSTYSKNVSPLQRFFLYGLIGVALDVYYFAALDTLLKGELELVGRTNVIVLPVYGLGFLFLEYFSSYLKRINVSIYIRCLIYTLMGHTFEFMTGYFLLMIGHAYWDYSDFSYNFKGIIIPHTAPGWFLVGLAADCVVLDAVKGLAMTSK